MEKQYTGVIVRYKEDRGFGFLFCDELDRRVFYSIKEWKRGAGPRVGEEVKFRLGPSHNPTKPEEIAVDVRPTGVKIFVEDAGKESSKAGV